MHPWTNVTLPNTRLRTKNEIKGQVHHHPHHRYDDDEYTCTVSTPSNVLTYHDLGFFLLRLFCTNLIQQSNQVLLCDLNVSKDMCGLTLLLILPCRCMLMSRSETPRDLSGLTSSIRCSLSRAPGVRMALSYTLAGAIRTITMVCLASSSCCLYVSVGKQLLTSWYQDLQPALALHCSSCSQHGIGNYSTCPDCCCNSLSLAARMAANSSSAMIRHLISFEGARFPSSPRL